MTEQKERPQEELILIDVQNIEELFTEENLMFLLTLKIDQIWIKGLHIRRKENRRRRERRH